MCASVVASVREYVYLNYREHDVFKMPLPSQQVLRSDTSVFPFLHSRPAPGGLRHVQWRVHPAARPPLPLLRALPYSRNHRSGTLRSQAPFSCLVINKNRVPFVQPLY